MTDTPPPTHGHDRDHFDASARDWDDESKRTRGRVVAAAVRTDVALDADTRVLEYGAGTGLATEFLATGPLGRVTLADPSAGMRDVMADKVADGRLPSSARIVDLDLSTGDVPEDHYDLVLTVMTLHHIPDLGTVLSAFARLLDDGGHLCIVDLEDEDGSFHRHLDDFHGHDGFTEEELGVVLVGAGFEPPTWRVVHHVDKDDRSYPLFLATTTPAGA